LDEGASCPHSDTHSAIEPGGNSSIRALILAANADEIDMSALRRLLADEPLLALHRISDRRVLALVAELVASGRIVAIECRGSRLIPTVTVHLAGGAHIHLESRSSDFGVCSRRGRHIAISVTDTAAREGLLEALRCNPRMIAELRRFWSRQYKGSIAERTDDEGLLRELAIRLATGEMRLVKCTTADAGSTDRETAAEYAAASGGGGARDAAVADEAPVKTWIEVELIDDRGSPVPYARYRLKLPDGTETNRSLDANGQDRVTDIDPGVCRISFLDFDAREWSESQGAAPA
jgi:hypothetical protein